MPVLPLGPGPQQEQQEGQADPGPPDRGPSVVRCVSGSDPTVPTPTPLPDMPAQLPARQPTMAQSAPVPLSPEDQPPALGPSRDITSSAGGRRSTVQDAAAPLRLS